VLCPRHSPCQAQGPGVCWRRRPATWGEHPRNKVGLRQPLPRRRARQTGLHKRVYCSGQEYSAGMGRPPACPALHTTTSCAERCCEPRGGPHRIVLLLHGDPELRLQLHLGQPLQLVAQARRERVVLGGNRLPQRVADGRHVLLGRHLCLRGARAHAACGPAAGRPRRDAAARRAAGPQARRRRKGLAAACPTPQERRPEGHLCLTTQCSPIPTRDAL
jgi:hypothetical protein